MLSPTALEASPVSQMVKQVIANGNNAEMPIILHLTSAGTALYVEQGYAAVLGDAVGNHIATITNSESGKVLPADTPIPRYVFIVTTPVYTHAPVGTAAPTKLIIA